jgi:hypothetical protein
VRNALLAGETGAGYLNTNINFVRSNIGPRCKLHLYRSNIWFRDRGSTSSGSYFRSKEVRTRFLATESILPWSSACKVWVQYKLRRMSASQPICVASELRMPIFRRCQCWSLWLHLCLMQSQLSDPCVVRIERTKASAVSRTTLPLWCFLKIHIGLLTVYDLSTIVYDFSTISYSMNEIDDCQRCCKTGETGA